MPKTKIRPQTRIPGVRRRPTSTALLPAVRRWIEQESRRFGVAKSFVVAVCVAEQAGIEHEAYDE